MRPLSLSTRFGRFATAAAQYAGHPLTFSLALGALFVWALSGPPLQFSEAWQLTVNTGTTIITFLMVFLIQNSQNRESKAVQTKLDEIIRALETARNSVIDIEDLPDEDIDEVRAKLVQLAEMARPQDAASSPE